MKAERILIAEDSLTQLEQLKYILEKNDYEVATARNGQLAYQLILQQKPDLVITDIIMPEMGGYELCREIKNNDSLKDVPVMLLTSLSDPMEVIKGLIAGADNFLTKPYNEQFIISRIKYILINRELRKGDIDLNKGISVVFGDEKFIIHSDRHQIIDLLLSTYESAVNKNSELKESNKKLLAMHAVISLKNSELVKLNQDKNKFLSIASHDLRNPIGNINSASNLLIEELSEKLNEEDTDLLKTIRNSSEYMLSLLNDLLDIAVIETGQFNLNLEKQNLVELVSEVIKSNKLHASNKQIKLLFTTDLENAIVNIDKLKIEQVLSNLISNALKFSYPDTSVQINLVKKDSEIEISVKDEGQGIPAFDLENLFTPFAKISVKGTAGERNTGLGLSIAKNIIEKHQGRIWVESEVGKGSTFFFTLSS